MSIEQLVIDGEQYLVLTGEDVERAFDRGARIARLQNVKGMRYRAAAIVVDKAMGLNYEHSSADETRWRPLAEGDFIALIARDRKEDDEARTHTSSQSST